MNLKLARFLVIAQLCLAAAADAQSTTRPPAPAQAPAAAGASATVTKSVNVDGVSFKTGDTIAVESIDKLTESAVTTRNGKKFRVPLKNLEMEAPIPQPTGSVAVLKAGYGVPGAGLANVTAKVQELVNQTAANAVPEILVSGDTLLKPTGHASEKARAARSADHSGRPTGFGTLAKNSLFISYTVHGEERTAQGEEGEKVLLK
jgi:hypothetical protein